MATIKVSNLTFYYEGSHDLIFKDVSFEIDSSWKLGFCGRNGRGKTTFLKLLMGDLEYRGRISANVSFDYFPFKVEDKENLVLDLIQEIATNAEEWEIRKELSQVLISDDVLYRSFESLSSGEQTKVLLVALFLKENNFLLIDEPTNHLDIQGRGVVKNYLKGQKGFILVSHDRDTLDGCTDHTLSINRTNIEIVKGSFSSWWENTKRHEQYETKVNERLSGEIEMMEKEAKRNRGWADRLTGFYGSKGQSSASARHARCPSSRQARLHRDAKRKERVMLENIEEKKKLLLNVEEAHDLEITPLVMMASELLRLEDISVTYGDRNVIQHFDLTVHQGERIALIGKNGSGKSSLLKLIIGQLTPSAGGIHKVEDLVISYVAQDASHLSGNIEAFAMTAKIDLALFREILDKLDFTKAQLEKDMKFFSAGQKKKVLIAKSLAEKAHLYIWDEPLNYIDVVSRAQIEALIETDRPTMILVEHDARFVENTATKRVKLSFKKR